MIINDTFKKWYEESDMPMKDENGKWVDMETGHTYANYLKQIKYQGNSYAEWADADSGLSYSDYLKTHNLEYSNPPKEKKQQASAKVKKARTIAKAFGGKALKGSKKQKEWAEKIRAERLEAVTQEQAELLCYLETFEHSTFWIGSRNASVEQIGKMAEKAAILIKKANKLYTQAQNELVVEEGTRLIIGLGDHDKIMAEREPLMTKYANIKLGNF